MQLRSPKKSPPPNKLKPYLSSFFFKSLRLFAVILLVFSMPACDDDDSYRDYYDPKVVMDGSGNYLIVSMVKDNVSGKDGVHGGGCDLSDTSDINNVETGTPDVAMDASGTAIAVYVITIDTLTGRHRNVYARRYVPGSENDCYWEAELPIDSDNTELIVDDYNPKVAMDGYGRAVAVWVRDYNIHANYFTPGGGWEGPQIIGPGSYGGDEVYSPHVAMFSDGSALAVWDRYDLATGYGRVYMNRYVPGSGWQTEEPVSSEKNSFMDYMRPRIATNPNTPSQMAVIVWKTVGSIYASRYVAGNLEDEVQLGSGDKQRVAMDANGNAIVVWRGGGVTQVYASRYDVATGVWQTEEGIAWSDGAILGISLAMDSAGNATALAGLDYLEGVITAIRYIAGSGWQEPFAVETSDREEEHPSIAMDDSGITVAAWDGLAQSTDARKIYTRVWEVWGAPTANFTISPGGGASVLIDTEITCNASGSSDDGGEIVSYQWDFDYDGTTFTEDATGVEVTHTYTAAGDYTIKLIVTDNDGKTDTTTRGISIVPTGDTPTACFTRTPIPAIINQPIDFDASCSTGTVVDYEWDFDYDGTFSPDLTATGAIVPYTYYLEGVYTVMLRVTNDSSMTDETTQTVTVGGGGLYTLTVATVGTATGRVYTIVPEISCGILNGTSYTDCTLEYPSGWIVYLFPEASSDAVFTQWGLGDCDSVSGVNRCEVTMNSDRTVTAQFDFP